MWFKSLKSLLTIWKFWKKGDVKVSSTEEGINLERVVDSNTEERLKIKIGSDEKDIDNTRGSPQ